MNSFWDEYLAEDSSPDELQKGFPSQLHRNGNPFLAGTADAAAGGTQSGSLSTGLSAMR
jgi:hypothetical protein